MQDSYYISSLAEHKSYRLETHKTVSSTNQLALCRARDGDRGHLWLVSQEQTQGIGRRGRVWHSPPGNLYSSLLLIEEMTAPASALLGFVAGVTMAETLTSLTETAASIHLKWPNDVLFDGAKITGILIERHSLPQKKTAIIIGIGINVIHAPQQANYPVTSLAARGFDITPAQIFNRLSHFWAVNFELWHQGDGFAQIRKKWLRQAAGLGEEIHIERPGQRLSGLFKTIDEQGQLVIECHNGALVTIAAGDVHFGEVATWRPGRG